MTPKGHYPEPLVESEEAVDALAAVPQEEFGVLRHEWRFAMARFEQLLLPKKPIVREYVVNMTNAAVDQTLNFPDQEAVLIRFTNKTTADITATVIGSVISSNAVASDAVGYWYVLGGAGVAFSGSGSGTVLVRAYNAAAAALPGIATT